MRGGGRRQRQTRFVNSEDPAERGGQAARLSVGGDVRHEQGERVDREVPLEGQRAGEGEADHAAGREGDPGLKREQGGEQADRRLRRRRRFR